MDAPSSNPGFAPVVFVNMPVAGIERPSIALGLMKSILAQEGIASEVAYANLWFLDYFNIGIAQALAVVAPEHAVVDWLFAAAAFPDFEPDHDAYLDRLLPLAPHFARAKLDRAGLLRVRGQIPAFVDWTARRILARKPRIVGCTSMFQQHVASLALLRRVRELAPSVVTMLGGANCESVMGRTTHAHHDWVDYVVSGEADQFIAPFMADVLAAGADEIAADRLPFGVFGPVHRRVNYPVTGEGDGVPRAVTDDLRQLPLPDYYEYFDELKSSLYANLILPGLPMEFSRGCWWGAKSHCTFCGLNGGNMAFRAKAPAIVAGEIDTLSARHGVKRIEAVDNIMDMAYFKEVLPTLAARETPLTIFFETKSNLKKAQVKALADAGVKWIQPGIESLDSRVLTLMRKGCTAAQNILLLKWCRQYGIRTSWSIITEFPGEEDGWYAEMAAIMPALVHLQAGVSVPLRYDRYSPYFTAPDQFGVALAPSPFYAYAYPLDAAALADQVYFFENANAAPSGPEVRPGLAAVRQAVLEWRRAWLSGPPVLTMSETADGLLVEDTRPGGTDRTLTGLARALILAADDGPPEAAVNAAMAREGFAGEAVEAAVAALVADRLLLRLDGRLIGLPLTKPHTLIPAPSAFPGGYVAKGAGLAEQFLATV
ncbi:RiPP maturation radical SAM C-methyltransferase [Acuticoccus kandeliae]|uniref:RiPP maturation radical SAM C-methyltransferase n=1 Tax=Acuticoccus kandeliae TaxID=2073160 RepID=UPI00196B60BF|nr:RiPP maturation radical SAM C-methyltransferase [Acuticoccus kandeliae]